MTLLLGATAKVTLLVLSAILTASILRRRSAALRHWALATALVCGLSLPALEFVLPAWAVPLPASWSASSTSSSLRFISGTYAPEGGRATVSTATDSVLPDANGLASYARLLLSIWLVGLTSGLAVLAVGLVHLARLASRSTPACTGRWREIVDEISRTYGLRRPVRLLHCAHPTMLVTWGTFRPAVLLPASAHEWPDDRLRVVLHHELAHIRRGDWAITMSATVLRCIYWFNPLLWIACRQLRQEGERACDDLVLSSGVRGTDYAAHLVAIARESAESRHSWSPAIAIARRSTLEGRVRAMLDARVNRQPLTGSVRTATLALVLATALSLAVVSLSGNAAPSTTPADIAMVPAGPLSVGTAASLPSEPARPSGLVAARGAAQAGSGAIEGVLYDQFGGLLPGVSLTLTSTATNRKTMAVTDRAGAFAFKGLPTGDYELVTELPGFTSVRNVIRAEAGLAVRRHITLPTGTISETIAVTCEASAPNALRPTAPPGTATPGMPAPRTPRVPQGTAPRIPSTFTGGIGGQISAPHKLTHANPVCPTGVPPASTVVRLAGRIGIDGLITDLRDVSQEAQPAFVASAMEAARQWEFTPTLLNGAPIEVNIAVTVDYRWSN